MSSQQLSQEELSNAYANLKEAYVRAKRERDFRGTENLELKKQNAALLQEVAELRSNIKEGYINPKTHRRQVNRYQQLEKFYQEAMAELHVLRAKLLLDEALKF